MSLKDRLRPWRFRAACLPWQIAASTGLWRGEGAPVKFVIEKADWAIRWVGEHIRDEINGLLPETVETTLSPERQVNRVIHFGSQYMWLNWGHCMPRGNRYVTSFFHGKREDGPDVSAHIDQFLESVPRLDRIVTGAGIIEQRLLQWGVPREKLVRIPIGVDTKAFVPPTAEQRANARKHFGLRDDQLVVGSFQKDGMGWGDGMEPKFIKGPDIFVEAVSELARHRPVVAFLTGPARGYVKQALDKRGIPFVHTYAKSHLDLVACYHALDLYLVTSREEGGPMGLMESMASGVPVVSTAVGMAPDLIVNGITGCLVPPEQPRAIVESTMHLLGSAGGLDACREAARSAVMVADWSVVGHDHWTKVYQPLLR